LIGVRASSARCAKQKCYASHASDVTLLGAAIHYTIVPNSTVGHGEQRANLNQTPPEETQAKACL